MTVALYARRKSWPLEAVTVRLRHSKIHAADCADCETKEGMLDHIESDLEFAGRLTQEQRRSCLRLPRNAQSTAPSSPKSTFAPACCEQWRTSVRITQQGSCGPRSHVDSLEYRRVVPTVAVGTTIAARPPRRSVRARLRIRLLPWMNGGETHFLPHTVQSLGHALPALCRTHV